MIDFHQRLTELSQHSKTKTCWKIRYRGKYLCMSSGKESWTKKSAAKAALFLEFEVMFHAHGRGVNNLEQFAKHSWSKQWPITDQYVVDIRYKTAQKELLKLVEFVELSE